MTLHLGRSLTPHSAVAARTALDGGENPSPVPPPAGASPQLSPPHLFHGPLGRLPAQLILILLATRTLGWIFRRLRLPGVVGEITAGILLGPSLFGWLWPEGFSFIFAPSSLGILKVLSQIGVSVFMFVVGMEVDIGHLRDKARSAFLISQTGILVPFLFGTVSALFLYPGYAGAATGFSSFALFLGISMSITAFPVLVRILEERGMARSPLGQTAISCAAMGDASAWALLALVVAFVRAQGVEATFLKFAALAAFAAFMVLGVRRWLPRWLRTSERSVPPPWTVIGAVTLVMTGSALATEALGIHALFGAFLAGAILPRDGGLRGYMIGRLESVTGALLLPLFFAFSGLRTHIGLLNDPAGWLACAVIVAVATAGKLGSTVGAARLDGMKWNDAFRLGALMNTRGLMELIALNLGYDLGVLPAPIFAMLVIMALVTTFLTGPLLSLGDSFGAGT
jgi:Kef-type K+ transport system membrane component KefB